MAGSLNRAQLIGHLGKDPETRRTSAGDPVTTFRLATSESWTDKATGEKRERTEWHTIVIFNAALCDVADKYLRKGSKVFVEGRISTRKWQDQSGQDRYSTEIVLQGFEARLLLLDRAEKPAREPDGYGTTRPADYSRAKSGEARPTTTAGQFINDDIPF